MANIVRKSRQAMSPVERREGCQWAYGATSAQLRARPCAGPVSAIVLSFVGRFVVCQDHAEYLS